MFLYETMQGTKYYMPKTAVRVSSLVPGLSKVRATTPKFEKLTVLDKINWRYVTPSPKTMICPYKGVAEYYNLKVDGTEFRNSIWWYPHPTRESALIEGMVCFDNKKVDVYVDNVKEKP